MRKLLCLLCLGAVMPAAAETAHHWTFENGELPSGGRSSVFREGVPPAPAGEVPGPKIWDGDTRSTVLPRNTGSMYFGRATGDTRAPIGGEIVVDGGNVDLRLPGLTVEAFVRVEEQAPRFALIVSKRRDSGATWSVALDPAGTVVVRCDTQPGNSGPGFNRVVPSGKAVSDGLWHHVAMTFDDQTRECSVYVDYELCRSATILGPLVYDDAMLTMGRGLNGWIDEVRISDTVLHREQFLRTTEFFTDSMKRERRHDVMLDLTPTRVQTSVALDWEKVGTLKPKSLDEIPGDFWSLGCETLDRDLAEWDAYKGYLRPLGIRRIRLQGGWNKTEKEKGVYDFKWLDDIVNSAHSLGLQVCLETSYGNKLYEPGASLGPGGVLPCGDETLAAWDAWVEAMVRHYRPMGVREWMMYNEPNLRRENTVDKIVAFNGRTAEIIKSVDPDAKIAGLVAAGLNLSLIEGWLSGLQEIDRLKHFEWVIYHGYGANPDGLADGMEKARELVRQHSPTIRLWQGEAGCASEEVQYALSGIDWTELSHAKWNARRMLCDFAHEIESTVFTISDLSYHKDFISRYGLLKTAPDNSIIKVKTAYYVVNNVVSVFNDSVRRDRTRDVSVATRAGTSAYLFRDTQTGYDLVAVWDSSGIPIDACNLERADISVENLNIDDPVWVDLLTSRIYAIPEGSIAAGADATTLKQISIFDSPVVLTDRSVLSYVRARETKKRAVGKPEKKNARKTAAFPIKQYRLFGTQKPAPAIIICPPDESEDEWAEMLAGRLRDDGVHAFVFTDEERTVSEAVAHVRSLATAWQVDPRQVGIAGDQETVADYRTLAADFAVVMRADAGGKPIAAEKNLKVLCVDDPGDSLARDAGWLYDLLKWLAPRKTRVF